MKKKNGEITTFASDGPENANRPPDGGLIGADSAVDAALLLALRAPSAENIQPWLVDRYEHQFVVRHNRSKQMPSDPGGMLDYTGLGALVESIRLAVSEAERSASVHLLDPNDSADPAPPVARIGLKPGGQPDPLARLLATRCTRRRMNAKRAVPDGARSEVTAAARRPGARVDWVAEESLKEVAALVGDATRLRFEHREYHQEFYANLRHTPEEARRTRDGLDVATLQLPPGVAGVMRFFRRWGRTQFGNALGYSSSIGGHAAKEVRCSGAVGVLSVEEPTVLGFLEGGRSFLLAWLTAEQLGLAFHPVAGLTVFAGHAERGGDASMPTKIRGEADRIATRFRQLCPAIAGRVPQMMFRLGYGPRPNAPSLRLEPERVVRRVGDPEL